MDVFAVIADPTRRAMLDMMRGGEHAAGAFVSAFPKVSQPAISQHLKVLHDAGLVRVRADRQRRFYALSDDGLSPVQRWLAPFGLSVETPKTPSVKKPRTKPQPKPAREAEPTLDLFG